MGPLELMERYQIEPYRGAAEKLEEIAVAFAGALRKQSEDSAKVILINDPISQQGFFYEFRTSDIVYVEELPNIVMRDGSAVSMVRLWVRKGSTALQVVPFHVEATAHRLSELV